MEDNVESVLGIRSENSDLNSASGAAPALGESATVNAGFVAANSNQAARDLAQKNFVHGALWLVGGIAVTAVTYSIASSSPSGGHYLIAWGAIIFGGFQFLKGLVGFLNLPD